MREILQDTSCRGHLMPNAKKNATKNTQPHYHPFAIFHRYLPNVIAICLSFRTFWIPVFNIFNKNRYVQLHCLCYLNSFVKKI